MCEINGFEAGAACCETSNSGIRQFSALWEVDGGQVVESTSKG